MKKSLALRCISLGMFVVAIIFIACALANPALGSTFYIGELAIGAEVWRVFYAIYAIVMSILFVTSFFVGKSFQNLCGILRHFPRQLHCTFRLQLLRYHGTHKAEHG